MFPLAQKEHLIIPAHIDHLANLRDFIVQIGQKYGYSHKLVNAFKLAVDEAATNIIEHAYGDRSGYITVQAVIRRNALTINLTDQGAYFDPNWLAAPDLQQHVEHGKKGGLGIFIMRKLLDDVSYDKTEAGNRLSLTKNDPRRKGLFHLKRLWELPPTLRFKYFAQAVLLVTLVNAAGFAYFYFNSENESRLALDRLGKQISRQISEQIGGINASLLNGPDGLSYVQGITEPVRADHKESVFAISLEDSLGYVGWSTIKSQLTHSFSRPETTTVRKENVYEYTLDNGIDVVEYQRPISRPDRPVAFQKVHVFLTNNYERHQLSQIRLRYLKTACIALGASYILLAFVSYLLSYPVRKLNEWIRAARKGDVSGYLDVDASSGIGEIAQAFSDIADEIDKSQKHLARSERIEKEIKIAQDIQESLLPTAVPTLETLDIAARYEAAESVGGDYYDFIDVDQNHLGIVLADVSGKGVPGSLIMTMVRTALRTEARGATDAADVLVRVNDFVKNDMKSGIFVTMLYLIVDTRTRAVSFANAGHTPLIVHRGRTGKTYYLNPDGFPVGLKLPGEQTFEDSIKSEKLRIEADDTLLLYTDGVTEAMNDKQEAFGKERLLRFIRQHKEASLDEFCEKLRHEIYSFRENLPAQDDITFVAIRAHARLDEDAITEPMIEEGMSLESRFLSHESVTQILDVVAQHPEYDANDISEALNSRTYDFTEIAPGRIQAELLRQNIATRPKRRDFVKAVEAQTRNLERPATPKLTLSGEVKLADSSPVAETPKPEKPAKKKRKKKKTRRSFRKKKTDTTAASPAKAEPATPIELPPRQPDEPEEAEVILDEFIDELFSKTDEQETSAQAAREEQPEQSDPEAQAEPVAGDGSEAPVAEERKDEDLLEWFSDDDLSDSLVDSLLHGLEKDESPDKPDHDSAEQSLETPESEAMAAPAAGNEETDSQPALADVADAQQPDQTEEAAAASTTAKIDSKQTPAPTPATEDSSEPEEAETVDVEQSEETELPEKATAQAPEPAQKVDSQPLLLAAPTIEEKSAEEIAESETGGAQTSQPTESSDAAEPLEIISANEPDNAAEMAEELTGEPEPDSESVAAISREPQIEQEAPTAEEFSDAIIPEPEIPESTEKQSDEVPGLDKSLLPSFIFTKIFGSKQKAEESSAQNGDSKLLAEEAGSESEDETDDSRPAAEVEETAPADETIEPPETASSTSEPAKTQDEITPPTELPEAISPVVISKVEITWQPQMELDWPDLVSQEFDDKYKRVARRWQRALKNGAAAAERLAGQTSASTQTTTLVPRKPAPEPASQPVESTPGAGQAAIETQTSNKSEHRNEPLPQTGPEETTEAASVAETPATAALDTNETEITPDATIPEQPRSTTESVTETTETFDVEKTPEIAEAPADPERETTADIEITSELVIEEPLTEQPETPTEPATETTDVEKTAEVAEVAEAPSDPEQETAADIEITSELVTEEPLTEQPETPTEPATETTDVEKTAEVAEVAEAPSDPEQETAADIEITSELVTEEPAADQTKAVEASEPESEETVSTEVQPTSDGPISTEPATDLPKTAEKPAAIEPRADTEQKKPAEVESAAELVTEKTDANQPEPAGEPALEASEVPAEKAAAAAPAGETQPKAATDIQRGAVREDETPDDVDALVRRGINCYKQKEFEDAIIFLNKALRLDSGFTDIYAMLGNAYFRNKMFTEAQQSYEILKEKGRATASVCENLGLIYWKSGIKEAALKEWKAVLQINPEREDLARRIQKIERDMRTAKNGETHSPRINTQIEPAAAPTAAKRETAGRPAAISLLQQGIEQYKLGHRETSIEIFERAIATFPDKKEAYHYLGNAYFRNRMYKEAAEVFERLKQLDSDDLRSKENLALVRARQGEYAQAIREWREVLQKEPDRIDLKNKIEKAAQLI